MPNILKIDVSGVEVWELFGDQNLTHDKTFSPYEQTNVKFMKKLTVAGRILIFEKLQEYKKRLCQSEKYDVTKTGHCYFHPHNFKKVLHIFF